MFKPHQLIAVCSILALSDVAGGPARAGQVYTLSGVTIDAYTGNPHDSGLIIDTHVIPTLPDTLFTLNDGQSQTFKLFDIWTPETKFDHDDRTPQDISVTLTFSSPSSSGTVSGTTEAKFYGLFSLGEVEWQTAPVVVQAPGVTYSICLEGTSFNPGFFDQFTPGPCYGGTVEATVEQLCSVPEPASLVSASLGLVTLGAGWYLRRRRAAA